MDEQRRSNYHSREHRSGLHEKVSPLAAILKQQTQKAGETAERPASGAKKGLDLLHMGNMDLEEPQSRNLQSNSKSNRQEARKSSPKEPGREKPAAAAQQKQTAASQPNWGPELKSNPKKRDGSIEGADEYLDAELDLKRVFEGLAGHQDAFRTDC